MIIAFHTECPPYRAGQICERSARYLEANMGGKRVWDKAVVLADDAGNVNEAGVLEYARIIAARGKAPRKSAA